MSVTALPRYFLTGLIHTYRLVISPLLGPNCRFEPSCSAYAAEALHRYGVIKGSWLTIKRLGKCHPWGGCGFDPVPDPNTMTQCQQSHKC